MLISLRRVVPPARFQRATSRLGGERSMQLSYGSTGEGIVIYDWYLIKERTS